MPQSERHGCTLLGCSFFLIDMGKELFTVAEELLQLPAGLEHLCSGADKLQQVLPGRIQVLVPLSDY